MDSDECLRICVTLEPTATIFSSLSAHGKTIADKTFRETDCAQPWVNTLQAIAGATRISGGPDAQPRSDQSPSPTTHDPNSPSSSSVLEQGEPEFTHFGNHSSSQRRKSHWPSHARSEGSRHSIIDTPISTTLPTANGTEFQSLSSHVHSSVSENCVSSLATAWSNLAHVESAPDSVTSYSSRLNPFEDNVLTSCQVSAPASLSAIIPLSPSGARTVHVVSRDSTPSIPTQIPSLRARGSVASSSTQSSEASIDVEVDVLGSGSDTLAGTMDISTDGSPMPSSPTLSENTDRRKFTSNKRMKKLQLLLDCVRDHVVPAQQDHNDKVNKLYSNYVCSPGPVSTSMEQFGQILGRLGNLSNALGVVYGLLSWEIFRREEERLVREERQSSNIAAKRMNDKMAALLNRRAKAKDWASDGRRAAGMIFGAITAMSTAGKSFALLQLADLVTLDGLLKIAHFPALREHFVAAFIQIQESRKEEWEGLAVRGYQIFDHEEFLRRHTHSGSLIWSASLLSPVPVPELTASVASSSPQSQPTDFQSRHSGEHENVLGKRRREIPHAYSGAAFTESEFLRSNQKEANVDITQIDLGNVVLTPSGVCPDQGNNFASPQTQDFLTLFQNSMNYEFDGRFGSGCHSRDKIDSNRMV